MKPTKIYQFTVPAFGSFPLLISGDYFKIIAATGALNVRGDSFGTIDGILPGQGLSGTPFQRLEVVDTTGSANLVKLLVADEAFVDDRITGEVSVIDGARARTSALMAFAGTMPVLNVAAQYSQAQLWNPPGSGKRLVVNAVAAGSSAACNVYLAADSAQMATAGSSPANKKLGGAAGIALIRKTNLGTIQPASVLVTLNTLTTGVGVTTVWKPTEPVVVEPGFGLSVSQDQVNLILTASFEWFEESIL